MLRAALATLLLTVSTTAFGGTPELIKAVEAKYAGVETMSADFTQVTKSELYGADEQVGKMVLKRPSMMRWDFTGDGKQFVTDGKTMWIYNAANKQVLKYDDVSNSASSADSLLQSLDRISEIFEVELLEETETMKRLSLTPKADKAQVKKIELRLDGDLVVQEVTITDAFETQTALAFAGVKLGEAVDDATFQFQVPEGAEVISAN